MTAADRDASKVPEVTVVFWVMKIAATTLGETAGDTITMTLSLGYLVGTAIFFSLLIILVAWQIAAKSFHPVLYWATIVASTTAGTTMADFADRSLGVGYAGGSSILFVCLMVVLGTWYWSLGSISVATVATPKVEAFYWAAITFSQTLGTALGDWIADDTGLRDEGGALLFAAALAGLIGLYFGRYLSRNPTLAGVHPDQTFGATVRDFLDKPISDGGLGLKPANCICGHRGIHRGLSFHSPAKSGGASRRFGACTEPPHGISLIGPSLPCRNYRTNVPGCGVNRT